MEPSKNDILVLVADLRAEIRAWYAHNPFSHDFHHVLRKMDKLDLLLQCDYERLWQMEREDVAILKAKEAADHAAIKALERQLHQRPAQPTPLEFSPICQPRYLHGQLTRPTTPTATDEINDMSSINPSDRRGSCFDMSE